MNWPVVELAVGELGVGELGVGELSVGEQSTTRPRGNKDDSNAGGFGFESFIFFNFLLQL